MSLTFKTECLAHPTFPSIKPYDWHTWRRICDEALICHQTLKWFVSWWM